MGRRVVEDVVALRALPGQNPGPGERGGGWDANRVSGWDDKSQTVWGFSHLMTENVTGRVHVEVQLRPHTDGRFTKLYGATRRLIKHKNLQNLQKKYKI